MSEDLNTEVAILKREVADIKLIFNRLDTAIERHAAAGDARGAPRGRCVLLPLLLLLHFVG